MTIFGRDTTIWKSGIWECKKNIKNINIREIAFKVVQMKFLAIHITYQKLSFDIFTEGNVQNIFMEHDLYYKKKKLKFWPIQCIFWLLLQIYPCDLWLVLWSKVTFTMVMFFFFTFTMVISRSTMFGLPYIHKQYTLVYEEYMNMVPFNTMVQYHLKVCLYDFLFLQVVSYAQQGCIYFIQNTVKQ